MQPQKTLTGSRFLYYSVIIFLLSASGLVSCKEQDENYFEEETLTQAISVGMMEAYDALEVDYLTEVALMRHPAKLDTISFGVTCASFTLNPNSLNIKFDSCVGPFFNRVRQGVVNIAYPTVIGDTLTNRTITFTNYYVAGRKIEGQIELQNIKANVIDTTILNIQGICRFTNFKVTFPEGTAVTYNGSQSRLWNFGFNDGNPNNNTYKITDVKGLLTGNASGSSFTTEIDTTAVTLNYTCPNLNASAGIVHVTSLSGFDPTKTREVDFGGKTSCDGTVTVITWRRSFSVLLY